MGAGSSIGRVICVPSESIKIYGNPDESRRNSLDPSGCLLAKVAGAKASAPATLANEHPDGSRLFHLDLSGLPHILTLPLGTQMTLLIELPAPTASKSYINK